MAMDGQYLLQEVDGGAAWCVCGVTDKLVEEIALPQTLGGRPIVEIAARAFAGCKRLKRIVLPRSVVRVGVGAFDGCTALTSAVCTTAALVDLPRKSVESVEIIGGESIPVCAFERCGSLRRVEICEGVREVGAWAFACCGALREIVLPTSVERIGERAFHRSGLESISLPGVREIGASAFANCNDLQGLALPSGLCRLGKWALLGCTRLTAILVDVNNTKYCSLDGNLYEKDGKTLLYYAAGKQETAFVVPKGVTEIGAHAFEGCGLESVAMQEGVLAVGDWAFHGCKRLKSVRCGGGLRRVGKGAFHSCEALSGVELPAGVEFGEWAFLGSGVKEYGAERPRRE